MMTKLPLLFLATPLALAMLFHPSSQPFSQSPSQSLSQFFTLTPHPDQTSTASVCQTDGFDFAHNRGIPGRRVGAGSR